MKSKKTIERFGGLTKVEPLACIDDNILMPDSCVLESVAPFSGYYCDVLSSPKPQYLYLILEEAYTFETITRTTLKVREMFDHPIDVVTGRITLLNQTVQMLRVRNLNKYEDIRSIQQHYHDLGIQFKRKTKKFTDASGIIQLEKFFYLGPLGDGLFVDQSQPHHGYFIIPRLIEWKSFKELTKTVKYEKNLLFFDAATAYFYEGAKINDMILIYRENLNIDILRAIRNRYLKLLAKWQ